MQTIPRRGMQCWQAANLTWSVDQNEYLDLKDYSKFESGMTICDKWGIQVSLTD